MTLVHKISKHLDWVFILIYLILSIVFFKERTLFIDNAYQIFLFIQEGEVILNANRWPAIIVQLLPLLGVKMGASLSSILLLFSVSYALFHFIVFLLIRVLNKDRSNAVLLVCLLTIPVAHSFYWCNSELISGLSIMVLWLSFYEKKSWIWAGLLAIILPWFHPLLFVCFLFCTTYLFVIKKDKKIIPHAVLFGGSMLTKKFFFPSWFDTNANQAFKVKLDKFEMSDLSDSLAFLNGDNLPIILCLVLTVAMAFYKKEIWAASLLVSFALLYLFIIGVATTNYSLQFYIEVRFLCLFFVCLFTLKQISSNTINGAFQNGAFLVLVALALVRIACTSHVYSERQEKIVALTNKNECQRILYTPKEYGWLKEYWAVPYESLILSSLDSDSKAILFESNLEALTSSKQEAYFLTHFLNYKTEALNKHYFNLACDTYEITK